MVLLVFPLSAKAIVNIENMRADTINKTSGYDAKFAVDVNGKNGNTDKIKAGLGARYQRYEETGTDFLVLNYEYGESSDIKDTDKSFLHYRKIWYSSDEMAWEAFTQIESNEFTRLTLRTLLGGGARFSLFNDLDNHVFYLGLGVFRSKEKLEVLLGSLEPRVDYVTRANLYITYKYTMTEKSRLANTLYYQPDINETSDHRIFNQFAMQFDLSDQFSFKLSLDISRDNQPPQNVSKTDTSYNTGFEYRFD